MNFIKENFLKWASMKLKNSLINNNAKIDSFTLSDGDNSTVIIEANSPLSATVGFNHYLKYYCNITISWDVDVVVPKVKILPKIGKKFSKKTTAKNRFFLNYCTYGYTLPYWKWREWERLIDWMALNGVNMPLAMTGLEKVMIDTFTEYGLKKNEVLKWFSSPAHLPWFYMSNIDFWQGPLPEEYVNQQFELGQKIIKREAALGMKPVMMAFNGHVPREFFKLYPNANIKKLGFGWSGFKHQYGTYFLNPEDKLFAKIQKSFIKNLKKNFGDVSHYYGLDPFNEVTPPSWNPEYLAKVGKQIYQTLEAADKDAVWVQMGWLFYHNHNWTNERTKALLTSVPIGRMIVLDYFAENVEIWKKREQFYNVPFVWCYLGNFGSNAKLVGPIRRVYERLKKSRELPNFNGVGSTLEALDFINQPAYEYVLEQAWNDKLVAPKEWVKQYAMTRGGVNDVAVIKAWELMQKYVYNHDGNTHHARNVYISRPRLDFKKHGYQRYNYTDKQLFEIWTEFMKAKNSTKQMSQYQFDVVNVAREFLANYAIKINKNIHDAYKSRDLVKFEKNKKLFIEIALDQDNLMKTRDEFLIGKWIHFARRFGTTVDQKDYYERSARTLLTTWGGGLLEYANRDSAGLMRDYYLPRWELFLVELEKNLKDPSYKVDMKKINSQFHRHEQAWANSTDGTEKYIARPVGDVNQIVKDLYEKYCKLMKN
ncbi:alpha-N-acetylglucosaminidase TIM-barrel domain-containing protein [Lentisphaerota bacterium WC36G]|nr:alpha-N-acetylglucosaminidase [Lentisphaerae bacterium WC36]